jgi:hypothetical protein
MPYMAKGEYLNADDTKTLAIKTNRMMQAEVVNSLNTASLEYFWYIACISGRERKNQRTENI